MEYAYREMLQSHRAERPRLRCLRRACRVRRPAATIKVMAEVAEPLTDYSEDGVDLTLIRWFLSFTPAERLQFLQDQIDDIVAIRERNASR